MSGGNYAENAIPHYRLISVSRFLLVALNIDAILQESTIYRRRERLSEIIDGLGLRDAYGATIDRIKSQDGDKSRLGMEALMWISHAERPLRADELCHALAVKLGSRDFNAENIPSMSTLMSCCQGLITVDKEASTVRLIHFTLKEYLSTRLDIFTRPHSSIAELCLTYLNSEPVKTLSSKPHPYVIKTPFLGYCSRYWGVHAERDLSEHARLLALELLRDYDCHISARSLLTEVRPMILSSLHTSFQFNGLHCASFFGIVKVVAALIEMQIYDINKGDFWGLTPLAWAAWNGHEEAAKILLQQAEVNPDKADHDGNTPLSRAAWGGHEGVVKALLARNKVNPDNPNNCGTTPLQNAALRGHTEVVKILLGREEVKSNKQNNHGSTPLSIAAEYGHEDVVRILLAKKDVNPHMPDNDGDTPLACGAYGGCEGVVKILLEQEHIDPDISNNAGQTPLSYASWKGHERVVKILLEQKGVNPDNPNNTGRTPLSYAAGEGHAKVVEILLGQADVNPNRADNNGRTALMHAAVHGHQKVIELLQPHKALTHRAPSAIGDTTH